MGAGTLIDSVKRLVYDMALSFKIGNTSPCFFSYFGNSYRKILIHIDMYHVVSPARIYSAQLCGLCMTTAL